MRDQGSWCISLGRWGGVQVRLHMVFLVFAAFTLYLSWRPTQAAITAGQNNDPSLVWLAVLSLAVLLISVLLHELAHLYTGMRLGRRSSEIVLGPLGGLAPPPQGLDAPGEIGVCLAGPLMNLGLCLAVAPLLFLQPDTDFVGLLHPLYPRGVGDGPWTADAVKLTFWINWGLFCVNLIPAYPFDGGRALRATLVAMRPTMGRQFANLFVARLAKFAALGLLLGAWYLRSVEPHGIAPAWFALVLLSIVLYFSAKQEERHCDDFEDMTSLGYDFETSYGHYDTPHEPLESNSGILTRWLERRRQAKVRVQREAEVRDEMLMDEVLDRVHKYGLDSLSDEERALLYRVSQRYRGRLGNGA